MAKSKTDASFFQRILNMLFQNSDPEAEKKRQLKAIAKDLSKSGYKFYKITSDQVLPVFGKFFYDIYKIVAPAQTIFQTQQNPNYYKNLVINYSLSEKQKQLIEDLNEETIQNLSRNMPFAELKSKIKNELDTFTSEFDATRIGIIDGLYAKLMAFRAFCLYDYYFLLKKFDSTLREGDFKKTPKLEPIDAPYIVDDLKDFLSIVYSMPLDEGWEDLMKLFRETRNSEPVKLAQWNRVASRLRQLKDGRIFDMMIQLSTKDPSYVSEFPEKKERIIEPYIDSLTTQATSAIRKLESEQKNSKIDSLLVQIFNTNSILSLHNYTESKSSVFERKNLGAYVYARPLNYMKAFLVEFVKRSVREYADLVIIRGKWTTAPLSTQMSEDYHQMIDASDKITAFDQKHAEDAEIGLKLKTLLPRSERDKEAAKIIKTVLGDSNSLAKEFLINGTKVMISFAKTTKVLIEDYQKPRHEIITNWKELEHFAEHPINELGVEVYKKIYLFANLMQSFLQS